MTTGGGFIAGSIIGKMVLDMTGWKQSIAAVDKDGKALGSKFDVLGQKLQDVGTKMTIVGGAIVASFSAMIIKAAKYGDEMTELSQKVGINVTTLTSYKLAADKTGMSIDGLARGLKFLSMNMVEASKGTGDGADIFKELGISVTDASGKLRDTDVVLGEVAQAFSGMEGGAEKTTLAVKLFGRAGMDMIPFLNLGADGLAKERTEAERLGLVLSGPAADAQHEFNDQLDALKDATLGASMAIGSALIPAAQAVVKHLIDVAAAVVAWTKENPALTQGIGTIVLAVGGLLSILGPLTIAIGAVLKNIVYLRAAASKTIIFTITLAGVAIVTAAIVKMIKDFKDLKEAGESTAEALKDVALNFNPFKNLSREDLGKFLTDMDAARDKSINLKGAMILLGDAFKAIKGAIEQGAAIPIINLTALFKEFGLKTKTELTAELKKAEEALKLLKGSAEATPGAIKALEDKIATLKEGITGVTVETRSLAEQLGITFRADAEARIKKLNEALLLYRGKLTYDEIKRISEEINTLTASMEGLKGPVIDVGAAIRTLIDGMEDLPLTAEEVARDIAASFKDTSEDIDKEWYDLLKKDIPDWMFDLWTPVKKTTDTLASYFAGLYNDIAIGLGNAIQGFLTGWSDAEKKAIQGIRDAMWSLDQEFKKAQDALDQKYKDGLISQEDYLNQSKILLDDYNKAYKKLCDDMGKYTTGFGELFKNVWESIKTAFFRILGEMLAKWILTDLFGKILIELGVLKKAVAEGTGAMKLAFTDSFAKIALAAADLVISLGFIAVAIVGLLGFFGLLGDTQAALQAAIKKEKEALDALRQGWIDYGYSIRDANQRLREYLELIDSGAAPPRGGTGGDDGDGERGTPRPGYATGGIAWVPQFARVAEREPEIIMPLRKFRGAQTPGGAGKYPQGGAPNGPVNLTFNIKALDGADMINVVHNKIKPILQNILNHNGLRVPTGAVGGT